MVVVVRIARSFFLICTAVTAAICTWSSVHGRHCTHTHTQKKERRSIVARRQWCKEEEEEEKKRISKIVRATHSTTDNVDYHHNRHTYTYYNTYAALVSLDE
jgi:Mg2+/Co2+ transporter CorB